MLQGLIKEALATELTMMQQALLEQQQRQERLQKEAEVGPQPMAQAAVGSLARVAPWHAWCAHVCGPSTCGALRAHLLARRHSKAPLRMAPHRSRRCLIWRSSSGARRSRSRMRWALTSWRPQRCVGGRAGLARVPGPAPNGPLPFPRACAQRAPCPAPTAPPPSPLAPPQDLEQQIQQVAQEGGKAAVLGMQRQHDAGRRVRRGKSAHRDRHVEELLEGLSRKRKPRRLGRVRAHALLLDRPSSPPRGRGGCVGAVLGSGGWVGGGGGAGCVFGVQAHTCHPRVRAQGDTLLKPSALTMSDLRTSMVGDVPEARKHSASSAWSDAGHGPKAGADGQGQEGTGAAAGRMKGGRRHKKHAPQRVRLSVADELQRGQEYAEVGVAMDDGESEGESGAEEEGEQEVAVPARSLVQEALDRAAAQAAASWAVQASMGALAGMGGLVAEGLAKMRAQEQEAQAAREEQSSRERRSEGGGVSRFFSVARIAPTAVKSPDHTKSAAAAAHWAGRRAGASKSPDTSPERPGGTEGEAGSGTVAAPAEPSASEAAAAAPAAAAAAPPSSAAVPKSLSSKIGAASPAPVIPPEGAGVRYDTLLGRKPAPAPAAAPADPGQQPPQAAAPPPAPKRSKRAALSDTELADMRQRHSRGGPGGGAAVRVSAAELQQLNKDLAMEAVRLMKLAFQVRRRCGPEGEG